jgi:hypothetical protein
VEFICQLQVKTLVNATYVYELNSVEHRENTTVWNLQERVRFG